MLIHPELLGDVVICPEVAQEQAKAYRKRREEEILLYLIHGVLHLLGYKDSARKDRLRMQKEQQRILKAITAG